MTTGDKGKLFILFVPLFIYSLFIYSARLCAPCAHFADGPRFHSLPPTDMNPPCNLNKQPT